MRLKYLLIIGILISCFTSGELLAQFNKEKFGKNRIQHKDKEWYFFTSNNFEVYYYDGGRTNARMAIDFLESEFDNLTQSIGYVAYTKPKIFIYNSKQELLESNLNLNTNNFTVDGQTFFSKLLAEAAYLGSWESFKKELLYKTSKIIIEEMLYGASISDAFQSNLVNNFPDWFIDGAAKYLAYGWSREMDDFVRHYLRDNENPKLFKLQDEEAGLVGQSIWNYVVEKYGRRYLSSILNLSRINRNEGTSIANTLGRRFKDFTGEWMKFYSDINKGVFENFKDINEDNVINVTPKNRFGKITDISFSPDGKNLAYVENVEGKFKVKVREVSSGKESVIFKGGYVSFEQEADYSTPTIAWRDTLNLVIGTFKRGVTTLRMRAIDGSSQDKIFLRNITQILDLDFSPDGRTMVLSAINNGKTEIYTLNMKGQGRRITNDVFDNRTPIYLNDSTIIYASNKVDLPDSLLTGVIDVHNFPNYYNLFQLNLGDTVSETRLTNLNHINLYPAKLNNATILFLSEQSGITNLMRLGLGNSVSSQVSAFNQSLESFDYDLQNNKWAYAVKDGTQTKLVLENFPNLDQFTPSTPRVQLEQAKLVNERISNRRIQRQVEEITSEEVNEVPEAIAEVENQDVLLTPADTSLAGVDLEEILSGGDSKILAETNLPNKVDALEDSIPSITKPMTAAINVDRLRFETEGGLDTDNYTFDTIPKLYGQESSKPLEDPSGLADRRSNILDAFRQQNMVKRVQGPRDYVPQFITSSLNTSFVVDPLRGFGLNISGQMTDLLDNHSIKGGVLTALDFRSGSDLYFEYEYRKYKLDINGRFDRRSILRNEGDLTFQKYVLSKTEVGVSYPFSTGARVSLSPFIAKTQYFNLNPDSIIRGGDGPQNRLDVNYAGGRAELVIDKTRLLGLYMEQGFKGKIGLVHYQGLNLSERSFSNVYLDLRNYQKIHKNITLATRLYAGGYFGRNPQKYLVGGMQNWLFNKFYQPPTNRPEVSPIRNEAGVENSNLLFAEFVDLRGFDYDEIRGNNVITFSTELRIPLFSYLSRGNITSNFIRNFQLVGFYDTGSSWSNSAPWERVNDQNTEVINTEGSPFVITLNNFNNPWLQSYGAGLRTVLLNYYVKFDAARPIRNYTVEKTRFYVTLGYNF
mgnify:FL=1